jgi:hypothetical protein
MDRLGVLDRCPGGYFTATIDCAPSKAKFMCPAGLTQVCILDFGHALTYADACWRMMTYLLARVRILDFDLSEAINLKAEIQFPEAGGIIQIENFGMHIEVGGSVAIRMKVCPQQQHQTNSVVIAKALTEP